MTSSSATTARSVPFFNYPDVFASHEEEFVKTFRQVGREGAFILQRHLADFEANLARYVGAAHSVGVGNATDGLLFALRAAGVGPGDEVIFCSHTMVATAAAIHFAGATPVPAECGLDHLMDARSVAFAITRRTRAILPTQLNGRTCDMAALQTLADRHGLLIIEDAAQALGSRFQGKCAGTFGAAAAISFYPAKVLGCLGDGGAVITNSAVIRDRLFEMRDHGRNAEGTVVSWGMNSRLDNLQAALLNLQLTEHDRNIARRREIARIYNYRFADIAELGLPPGPDQDPAHFDIFQNYEIDADARDRLIPRLKERGIGTLIPWGGRPVHKIHELGFTEFLPYTAQLFSRMLLLPMNLSLTDEDVHYVCGEVRSFYGYAA